MELSADDMVLLRIYLIMLGIKPKETGEQFLKQIISLIKKNKQRLNEIFNPELHFSFHPSILSQVNSLMDVFNLENYIISFQKNGMGLANSSNRGIRTLQILAQIIYEALQFGNIIPNRIESEIGELENVISFYCDVQDKLLKMKMVVQNH